MVPRQRCWSFRSGADNWRNNEPRRRPSHIRLRLRRRVCSPPYPKPSPRSRKRRAEARPGHSGSRRKTLSRIDLPETTYASRRDRQAVRLQQMIDTSRKNMHARRLINRLRRHPNDLFPFLDQPWVPFDNRAAKRAIRPAVIIRKNSCGNRSDRAAGSQAALMAVFRTLKQPGHAPIRAIVAALTSCRTTGQLPLFPDAKTTSLA